MALDNLSANGASFLRKTIGIQALFDVLKECLKTQKGKQTLDITEKYFDALLSPLYIVNFFDEYLMQSSAIGRGRLKNFMLYALGYKNEYDPRDNEKPLNEKRRLIKIEDKAHYDRLLGIK